MRINIKATNMELSPAVRAYVEKKLSVLEKYLEGSIDAVVQVEVGKTNQHHKTGEVYKAEVRLIGGGLDIYSASEQSDLYAAIDLVKDETAHKLSHLKGKKEALHRRGARIVKDMMKGFNPFRKR